MSAKQFILVGLLFMCAGISSAARCDSQGKCKYGGRCGSNNQCICPVNCAASSWAIDYDSLYCLPTRGGGYSQIFFNICHVMAYACEIQSDIPLIKFEYKKPRHLQCLAKKAHKWHLCPRPEDFMGQCGGTSGQYGSSSDGGVCLQHRNTGRIRCECSQGRYGENCELKILTKEATRTNATDEKNSTDYIGVSIGASLGAGVLLGMLISAILSAIRKRKRSHDIEHQPSKIDIHNEKFDENQKTRNNNRNNNNNDDIIVRNHEKITPSPSTSYCASKRQRLNGLSVSSSRSSGDSNNNLSLHQDKAEVKLVTPSTSPKHHAKATEVILPSCDQVAKILSNTSCGIKEAYTI